MRRPLDDDRDAVRHRADPARLDGEAQRALDVGDQRLGPFEREGGAGAVRLVGGRPGEAVHHVEAQRALAARRVEEEPARAVGRLARRHGPRAGSAAAQRGGEAVGGGHARRHGEGDGRVGHG